MGCVLDVVGYNLFKEYSGAAKAAPTAGFSFQNCSVLYLSLPLAQIRLGASAIEPPEGKTSGIISCPTGARDRSRQSETARNLFLRYLRCFGPVYGVYRTQ